MADTANGVAENYWDTLMGDDEHAATYMETYGEGIGSDTRKVVASFIQDGETVIDVGCGPGWNFDHFMAYGPSIRQYKGLDYSARFVRVANERNSGINPHLYELGDARDLKEADDSWDVVILQDILEHTNGYRKPVSEALRVAKKRVIISFWRMNENVTTKTNDDGNDGWGSDYNQTEWEDYLNTLDYVWHFYESSPEANRHHLFYVIDKENS